EIPAEIAHQRRLREEAMEKGFLVKNQEGVPLDLLNTSMSASLMDLSNPEARERMKYVIQDQLIANGFSGWMADFGEALPLDAQLKQADPRSFHNLYPVEWAKVNREAVEADRRGEELVFFTRAGFTRSPEFSTLFWAGD